MYPEESGEAPGAGPSGTGRAPRRGPSIGSDGAVTPLGSAAIGAALGADPPGRGFGTALPDTIGSTWTWEDSVRPAVAGLPEQRGGSPVGGPPEDTPGATSVVRPYVRTGGRTRPKLDLSLETLVSVLDRDVAHQLPHDEAAVLGICREQSRSVAEVAALHRVPIGVAKVIIGDLAEAGLLAVHRSFAATGPDVALMERVLGGLRRI